MHDEPSSHDAELSGLEAQLAGLAPRARLDRDRLMFAAGQHAAARRLRFANRALLATSLVSAGMAAMLAITPRAIVVPPAVPPAVDAPHLAGHAKPAAIAGDETTDGTAGTSVALLDGPTQFRLLQLLSNDPDARIGTRSLGTSPAASDGEASPPSYPRSLLKRYLESTTGRL